MNVPWYPRSWPWPLHWPPRLVSSKEPPPQSGQRSTSACDRVAMSGHCQHDEQCSMSQSSDVYLAGFLLRRQSTATDTPVGARWNGMTSTPFGWPDSRPCSRATRFSRSLEAQQGRIKRLPLPFSPAHLNGHHPPRSSSHWTGNTQVVRLKPLFRPPWECAK
ncbi:hypothetical protein LZ30DRAFT_92540 [Colletotrichum cereale]|nr:hypothetical protein LZ30DRAFT_92540 [Colletotrichum cereale]